MKNGTVLTLIERFERSAAKSGEKCAFRVSCHDGPGYDEISYRDLKERSDRLAASLQAKGVEKGERILIVSRPRSAWAVSLLGILKARAVALPVDASWQPGEVQRVIRESDAVGAIVDQAHAPHIAGAALDFALCMDPLPHMTALDDFLASRGLTHYSARPEDLAVFMCTSGTTGNSKIVMLAHENISMNLQAALQRLLITEQDRAVSIAPWYHIFGLITTFAILDRGATLIYTDDFKNLAKYLEENQATILAAVPKLYHVMFAQMENRLKAKPLTRFLYRYAPKIVGWQLKKRLTGRKLRFFLSGSAPLDPEVEKGFRRLGIGLIEGYGMTETAPVLTFSTPFNEKYGSVGPAIEGVELRIEDPDRDGVGEVVVRGPNVMRGYYQNPQKTSEIIDSRGWLHTGDLGRLDADGWLYLKGRKKNVIVLESGKNVYPEEIEAELVRIPYIEDVMIKGGQRDGVEVIKAFVYPKWDQLPMKKPAEAKRLLWEAIRAQSKKLASYKRLRSEADLILLDQPLAKTSKLDIKRYLYDDEAFPPPSALGRLAAPSQLLRE
jgi:long-chain acyl-CoA synthetase